MSVDVFDAGRRALEDRDRTDALVADARRILAGDRTDAFARLMASGSFSRPDAYSVLKILDWEDSRG